MRLYKINILNDQIKKQKKKFFMNELSSKLSKYFNKNYENLEKKYQDRSLSYLTESTIDVVAKIIYLNTIIKI